MIRTLGGIAFGLLQLGLLAVGLAMLPWQAWRDRKEDR